MGSRIAGATRSRGRRLAEELKDMRNHWAEWRLEWERKLAANEIQFLRSVADLQGGFQHRADPDGRQPPRSVRAQHADFHARPGAQRRRDPEAPVGRPGAHPAGVRAPDPLRAAPRPPARRGSRSRHGGPRKPADAGRGAAVPRQLRLRPLRRAFPRLGRVRQSAASSSICPTSPGCRNVLDIGCGRGEFLEMMREAGVPARGIDLSAGIGGPLPPQGPGRRNRRPVPVPGGAARSLARRHLLLAGGGASRRPSACRR